MRPTFCGGRNYQRYLSGGSCCIARVPRWYQLLTRVEMLGLASSA